ncbi:plasmolipin isoform X1 [Gallus gallus]|uniref:plasmolipin isoform X1 n=1 Tax=Gallus gallus TaxID=9031 RepID=UPI001EFFDA4E|nr:plasmolipin isoform X1 [Gallus gallus]XP_046781372.1 plasmolipin isoform X1 [Gallus gallus]
MRDVDIPAPPLLAELMGEPWVQPQQRRDEDGVGETSLEHCGQLWSPQCRKAYGWVLFVSIFLWVVTVLLFVMYLLQLPMKFYMVPWPLMLMIFNAVATVLYIAAFVTCSAAVRPTSWRQWDYNRRAAASFFAGLVMLTYGASTFFSFRAWKGLGSNAATSQAASHA